MKKQLSQVLPFFENQFISGNKDVEISSLVFDSRDVKPGSLFFALPGTHTTGNKFIPQAVANGAAAVVFEGQFEDFAKYPEVSFVKVPSARFAMGPLSEHFYDNPSGKLVVIGVTGTEGKSSTVSFLWQLLKLSGIKAGFISTVQYSLGDDAIDNPQHQTTPEAPIVQRQLYEMLQNGCTYAVVESSSHGLSEKTNRLGNVLFDCGIFMNVTLEHLEFHGTYEQYKSDKANLFRALDKHDHKKIIGGKEITVPSLGIVNAEDKAAEYFAECTTHDVYAFTAKECSVPAKVKSTYRCSSIVSDAKGISFDLTFDSKTISVKSPLPGAFNSYNLTATLIAISKLTGKPVEELAKLLEAFTPVKGRMTVIDQGQPFEVIVDYAHTPSSFQTIFPPIRNRCKGKMICVFGSGGERDTKKRPLQGALAAEYCDIVILADEDPRGEEPMALLEDIAKGAREKGKVDGKDLLLIPPRPEAIRKAFSLAAKDDIVLLLGKSHENSIIYKDYVMKYDEIEEAKKALGEL